MNLFDYDHEIHANSLAAYHSTPCERSERAAAVLAVIREQGPMTDRQVMRALKFSEPNAVRPRITELVKDGALVEVGSVRDEITGKTVRLVQAAY
jgi:predicted HTH transcriptional regulator